MIVKTFPLIRPGVFSTQFEELKTTSESIIVRPDLLSICAADQRYYFGLRPGVVLQKKLPMVLIHEAIGTVIHSSSPDLKKGDRVILLPCGVGADVNSNYEVGAFFRSSNAPGFCQELVSLNKSEVVKISDDSESDSYVFTELLSVCFQALRQVKSEVVAACNIAIWGDGSLGYLMSYLIKSLYPEKKLVSIGKHEEKLSHFSFSDQIETVFARSTQSYDLLIECVGGSGAQNAIQEMIDAALPRATILLTGVSESPPMINTRSILEKGLVLKGTTRSIREDFVCAERFLLNPKNKQLLRVLESERVRVKDANDLKVAFESSKSSLFKTVIEFVP